jgi:two-component system, response regulator
MNETPAMEILLVEDNPRDAELAIRALRKPGLNHPLLWLKDGVAVLEFFFATAGATERSSPQPKVILLDLKLPKVDGIEVLRRLKADTDTQTIPVVVLTSSREEQDIMRCYELGANSYIVKPVSFASFSEAVARISLYWLTINQTVWTASNR